eukprot:TRINITY_DN251_c0_g1_i1.p2 TRINITY_DN251_c0_g1~~TRINITY_DN251_c0_g1_i1.p2  ORF type:complete len:429 (+),score=118.16 TRINITY_DN251_c0_g1_i1:210-1496(+)
MAESDMPLLVEYYQQKIREARSTNAIKTGELQRLEVHRGALNRRVRTLRTELERLEKHGSHVGEVCRLMGRNRVLIKLGDDGKVVAEIERKPPAFEADPDKDKDKEKEKEGGALRGTKKPAADAAEIKVSDLKPGTRVACRYVDLAVHQILPKQSDPIVQLMQVEKFEPVTYDEIGGCEKQIREIREVVELPIKHPELFEALGIPQPKGVIMYGPPGTGKTMLARAVATQSGAKFIRLVGSELVQKYIGEGSRLVRDIFLKARMQAPAIIFMDEIDTIGSSRGGGESSEVQRTMMELLNQLDGFEPSSNIKVLMATNRLDILDSALLRPGRIDRKVEFPAPDEKGRLEVLRIHSRRMNLTRTIDLAAIAKATTKASGAELRGICMEAGMFALRERRMHVTQDDFLMAAAKVTGQQDTDRDIMAKRQWK